jgi:hypothetical protein
MTTGSAHYLALPVLLTNAVITLAALPLTANYSARRGG